MKKLQLFTIMLFVLTSTFSFSQERVNRDKLEYINESDIIDNVIGWKYDKDVGEWVSHRNGILYSKGESIDREFTSIQVKTIKYKNDIYYVFIFNTDDVWEDYNYYIFSEYEYAKIRNIEEGETVELKTKYKLNQLVFDDKSKYELESLDIIQTGLESDTYSEYVFPIMKFNDKILFDLPVSYYKTFKNYNFKEEYFEIESLDKLIITKI